VGNAHPTQLERGLVNPKVQFSPIVDSFFDLALLSPATNNIVNMPKNWVLHNQKSRLEIKKDVAWVN
jgi:hypothetical protein